MCRTLVQFVKEKRPHHPSYRCSLAALILAYKLEADLNGCQLYKQVKDLQAAGYKVFNHKGRLYVSGIRLFESPPVDLTWPPEYVLCGDDDVDNLVGVACEDEIDMKILKLLLPNAFVN